ncbi:transposase [Myxosarcina sp. GI1]|uniref:transposase n=1 Tax=Myxosarcina sp. GI1 TaxID=1541065 RepID=UPI000569159C
MAHSQKSIRDHARNRTHPNIDNKVIAQQLEDLVKPKGNPILDLRLVEIRHGRSWYRYLTSVLDPKILPPFVVGALYSRRWRIEESFLLLKRLLGLSYLWTGEPLRWAGSPT